MFFWLAEKNLLGATTWGVTHLRELLRRQSTGGNGRELLAAGWPKGPSTQSTQLHWMSTNDLTRVEDRPEVEVYLPPWFNLKISVWIPYNPMSSPTRPKKPWRSTSFWWFQRIFPTVRGSVLNNLTKFKREQRVSVIHIFHLLNLALVKWFLLYSLDVSLKPDFWRLHCFNFKTFFVHFVLIFPLSIWMGGTC